MASALNLNNTYVLGYKNANKIYLFVLQAHTRMANPSAGSTYIFDQIQKQDFTQYKGISEYGPKYLTTF